MLTVLATLAVREPKSDAPRAVEAQLKHVRTQAAAVRAVADHAEQLARAATIDRITEELVEEMARLGCRLLEAAVSLADAARRPEP
jgi:type II secretory pathway component PulM